MIARLQVEVRTIRGDGGMEVLQLGELQVPCNCPVKTLGDWSDAELIAELHERLGAASYIDDY